MLIASDYYATSEYMKGVEIQNFGEIEKCDEIINIYEQSPVQKSIRSYEETYYPRVTSPATYPVCLINYNMRCIEIILLNQRLYPLKKINYNMRCIEIDISSRSREPLLR